MVAVYILQISSLSVVHNKFYGCSNLKTWMCELCTFRKSSHIYVPVYLSIPCTCIYTSVCIATYVRAYAAIIIMHSV